MKDILSPRQRVVLAQLARSSALLAFDYDGVLAPLVKNPSGAWMRARTRALLRQVAGLYPCAVVSGRAWRDTRRFVRGVRAAVVGNHGFELGSELPVPREVLERVQEWRRQLATDLAKVPGVFFEDKRSTLAVHYGLARTWRRSGAAVHAAAERLHGARLVQGKKVLNVLPAHFPTKGDAVRALLARDGLETALYAGDDVTDEDVFEIGPPAVLGIHVGRGRSQAQYKLRSQDEIDALLGLLISLRGPGRSRRLAWPRPAR
jgi:trehalose 6-phosphate phosphatase